jgi:hypothetical protein
MDRHTVIAVIGLTKDRRFGGPISGAHYRKTLVVCEACHQQIHFGRYDGPALGKVTGEPDDTETVMSGSEGRGWKSASTR